MQMGRHGSRAVRPPAGRPYVPGVEERAVDPQRARIGEEGVARRCVGVSVRGPSACSDGGGSNRAITSRIRVELDQFVVEGEEVGE
jgi:hypothetical protein